MYDALTITAYFHIDCEHDTPTILIASVGLTQAQPNYIWLLSIISCMWLVSVDCLFAVSNKI